MILNSQKVKEEIVVAVDKFKGSLSASEVAKAISQAPLFSDDKYNLTLLPMADGGEGSLLVMESALQGSGVKRIEVETVDPLGRTIKTYFLFIQQSRTAFIEMASASGLGLLCLNERNPLRTSSFGFGELIRKAIVECGARELVLAIGGSATNDAGVGMLTALGYRFKINANFPSRDISVFLKTIKSLDTSLVNEVTPGLEEVRIKVACDVKNPLLGPNGATAVYAAQKGATPEAIVSLEEGMRNIVSVLGEEGADFPGAGAAGGVGYALRSVLKAELVPGWKLFSDLMGIEKEIEKADLVITGEGKFDAQSLEGKLPCGIIEICRKYNKRVWVICGKNMVPEEQWRGLGIERVMPLTDIEPNVKRAISEAFELIKKRVSI